MSRVRFFPGVLALVMAPAGLSAQATYQLVVKPDLKPSATLTLDGTTLRRSALKQDPGFRLQFAFSKDGKPLKVVQARGTDQVPLLDLAPGNYAAVLELFHPTYKAADAQKGQFRPASNELTFEVKAPAQPGGPVRVVLLGDRPVAYSPRTLDKPALVVQCGKEKEKELLAPGYDYQLVQGTRYDGWKPPAGKSHCWLDSRQVHVVLKVPAGVAGVLRLHAVDGDGSNARFRTQQLLVEGKQVASQAVFHGAGVIELVDVTGEDTRDGKVEVLLRNTQKQLTAVLSTIEFFPSPGR